MKINRDDPKFWTPIEPAYTLEERLLPWQRKGLTWTASGDGQAIPSRHVARLADGRVRRVYVTIYSDRTAWVVLDGTARLVQEK